MRLGNSWALGSSYLWLRLTVPQGTLQRGHSMSSSLQIQERQNQAYLLSVAAGCSLYPPSPHSSAGVPSSPASRSKEWSDFRVRKRNGGCRLVRQLLSWPGVLDFFPLGTGWAAALSLLVVYRAGMANQASTEPGEQRQGSLGLLRGEHLPILMVLQQGSFWLARDASLFLQAILIPHSGASHSGGSFF